MEVAASATGTGGFSPVAGALGTLGLGCLLAAVAFAVKGFFGARRSWHSWAALAASAGVVAVVWAVILVVAGC